MLVIRILSLLLSYIHVGITMRQVSQHIHLDCTLTASMFACQLTWKCFIIFGGKISLSKQIIECKRMNSCVEFI